MKSKVNLLNLRQDSHTIQRARLLNQYSYGPKTQLTSNRIIKYPSISEQRANPKCTIVRMQSSVSQQNLNSNIASNMYNSYKDKTSNEIYDQKKQNCEIQDKSQGIDQNSPRNCQDRFNKRVINDQKLGIKIVNQEQISVSTNNKNQLTKNMNCKGIRSIGAYQFITLKKNKHNPCQNIQQPLKFQPKQKNQRIYATVDNAPKSTQNLLQTKISENDSEHKIASAQNTNLKQQHRKQIEKIEQLHKKQLQKLGQLIHHEKQINRIQRQKLVQKHRQQLSINKQQVNRIQQVHQKQVNTIQQINQKQVQKIKYQHKKQIQKVKFANKQMIYKEQHKNQLEKLGQMHQNQILNLVQQNEKTRQMHKKQLQKIVSLLELKQVQNAQIKQQLIKKEQIITQLNNQISKLNQHKHPQIQQLQNIIATKDKQIAKITDHHQSSIKQIQKLQNQLKRVKDQLLTYFNAYITSPKNKYNQVSKNINKIQILKNEYKIQKQNLVKNFNNHINRLIQQLGIMNHQQNNHQLNFKYLEQLIKKMLNLQKDKAQSSNEGVDKNIELMTKNQNQKNMIINLQKRLGFMEGQIMNLNIKLRQNQQYCYNLQKNIKHSNLQLMRKHAIILSNKYESSI